MRFGRSRVQDRARNSDVETVTEEPSTTFEQSQEFAGSETQGFGASDSPDDAPLWESSLFVDSHLLTAAEGSDVTQIDANEPDSIGDDSIGDGAIDELRAATTAADARPDALSAQTATEICRLHEATVDAEQRAGRVLASPKSRRRLHDAVTEESDALHMLGFSTFDEFATAYAALPTVEVRPDDSAETIARIAEILSEIGIDPSADPLEAAREFLSTHEDDVFDDDTTDATAMAALAVPSSVTWANPPIATNGPEADALDELAAETVARAESPEMIDMGEPDAPDAPMEAEVDVAPSLAEAASAIEMAAARAEEASAAIEEASALADIPATDIPAGDIPAGEAPLDVPRDKEIVDRWISAEARAERMHAEVDRAQSELVALLARSAELESTVVARVSERDTAHADVEAARARVEELEQSIARSDSEHTEIDAALATSRDRITELETIAADREQAYVQSERDRVEAVTTIATLETNLAERTSESEDARAAVSLLEAQIIAQAADLDAAREELDTTHDDVRGLRTELETTRRSVSALDEHAEALEVELAQVRSKAESPEARDELDAVRQELDAARTEVDELEARRTETAQALARDRAELEQLHRSLTTTRELTATARNELSAARNAFEATSAKVESAERARQAITIDAAELLARAEADAANLLERAGRDAEAIRQEARLDNPNHHDENEAIAKLAEQVDRLERKLSKQLRKLAETTHDTGRDTEHNPGNGVVTPQNENAAAIVASAEREAMEIRRAARRDRDRFREELVGLLSRLAPTADDDNDYY